MSKESSSLVVFKIAGVLHALGALLMICVFVGMVAALLAGGVANDLLTQSGEEVDFPVWYLVIGVGISGALIALYGASAVGFFKMKKWQPAVFTVIIVLTFIELIANLVANGFGLSQGLSIIFLVFWSLLLAYTWKKRELFAN